MVVLARPNLLGALRARLSLEPEITALLTTAEGATDGRTTARIAGQRQGWWRMDPDPARSLLLRRAGGPPGDYLSSIWYSRIDLTAYGPDTDEAAALMDLVLPTLCPPQGPPAGSFTLAGVRVYDIAPEAEAITDTEPETGWPFCWLPVVVTWCGMPA